MNVNTITMDQDVAREKLRDYRRRLHEDAEGEYAACVAGYKAMAAGKPLINLDEVIRGGGFFEDGRPRLAVCRADRPVVKLEWWIGSRAAFLAADTDVWRAHRSPTLCIRVDMQRSGNVRKGYTMTPMIPADVRPKGHLKRFHILWEVEAWHDRSPITPPVDPYLLRHIHGSLWSIEAEWNLTELERAVMTGRRL